MVILLCIGSILPYAHWICEPSLIQPCLFSDGGGEQRAAGVEGVQFRAGAGLAQPAAALGHQHGAAFSRGLCRCRGQTTGCCHLVGSYKMASKPKPGQMTGCCHFCWLL